MAGCGIWLTGEPGSALALLFSKRALKRVGDVFVIVVVLYGVAQTFFCCRPARGCQGSDEFPGPKGRMGDPSDTAGKGQDRFGPERAQYSIMGGFHEAAAVWVSRAPSINRG